jgi:cell division protein FtsB
MSLKTLWMRAQSLGFFAFAIIVGCGVVLLFVPVLRQRYAMQQEIARLDAELIRQESLEKQQKNEIESLKTDPAFVERTARNKLNLARPGETIFHFEPPPNGRSASR